MTDQTILLIIYDPDQMRKTVSFASYTIKFVV
jgi:hypothetical protein